MLPRPPSSRTMVSVSTTPFGGSKSVTDAACPVAHGMPTRTQIHACSRPVRSQGSTLRRKPRPFSSSTAQTCDSSPVTASDDHTYTRSRSHVRYSARTRAHARRRTRSGSCILHNCLLSSQVSDSCEVRRCCWAAHLGVVSWRATGLRWGPHRIYIILFGNK